MYTVSKGMYKIGDRVEGDGMYLCIPCGFTQYFEKGSNFTTCDACLAGTETGPEGFREEASEFWQFIG